MKHLTNDQAGCIAMNTDEFQLLGTAENGAKIWKIEGNVTGRRIYLPDGRSVFLAPLPNNPGFWLVQMTRPGSADEPPEVVTALGVTNEALSALCALFHIFSESDDFGTGL